MTTAMDVLENRGPRWSCEEADALAWGAALPDDCIDLLITSPPYLSARTYSRSDVARDLDSWVAWMVEFVRVFSPKVRGLIAINCEGQTRDYKYLPAPFLLAADLHRAGFNLRKPAVFHRVGIPGSGGPDWLRNDYEPIICVTRQGRLPWSDNTACGHPPKWAPGGEMANRLSDGTRVNQWGKCGTEAGVNGTAHVKRDGTRAPAKRPSHKMTSKGEAKEVPSWLREGMHTGVQNKIKQPKKMYSRNPDGSRDEDEHYEPPVLANPGNVIDRTYSTEEVAELLGEMQDVLSLNVGGGVMGHPTAHSNEAPFPLDLPTLFVKSFCPPDGVVADPFSGSGTSCHAAFEHGRRFIGCDLRQSQVDLCSRRMRTITANMFS